MRYRPVRDDPTPMGNVAVIGRWVFWTIVGTFALVVVAQSACFAALGRWC